MHFFSSKSGISVTLVTRESWRSAQGLIDILVEAQQVNTQLKYLHKAIPIWLLVLTEF
jgi:hypothetical protein